MRVALVHDWLTGMRGGEYVLDAIAEMFPKAELFTLIHTTDALTPRLEAMPKHVSLLQRVPNIARRYRHFLPILPHLIEQFDFRGFDLIVSTSHCVAKGIRKPPGSVHVSYVFAPMRYMWDRFDDYFGPGKAGPHVRLAAHALRGTLQRWDRTSSTPNRVDRIGTLSRYIQSQIRVAYGRESTIIYPFTDPSRFKLPRLPGRNYLMVGAFAPYKRVDLAIHAFNRLRLPLQIVGSGQQADEIRKLAGPTVELLGGLSNAAIAELLSRCKAFVFPGQEDFGITPLEAMAAGAPVVAYGAGGALDTITPRTGILFSPQTVEALIEAISKLERNELVFDERDCRAQANLFTRERFQQGMAELIGEAWSAAGHPSQALEIELGARTRQPAEVEAQQP